MQLKQLLILLFALVALIPASLLTANSAYSIFKLQEQISNLYNGILVIIVGLDDGHLSLLQMKSDILSHIIATDPGQMQVLQQRIMQNERRFTDVLANYKEIGDFPLQVEIMKRRGLDHMITDDHELITQVRVDWLQYQATRDSLLSLSSQNRNSEAAAIAFGEANTRFDKLIASYQKTVDLNKEIARVLYDESNFVSSMAYIYSVMVFAFSFGVAIVVAMMLSKRMTSPIAEAQKRAKSEMDKFTTETSMVERHSSPLNKFSSENIDFVKTKEGEATEEPVSDEMVSFPKSTPVEMSISAEDTQYFNEILSNNQLILLHAELYVPNRETPSYPSSKFLQFIISSNSHADNAKVANSDAIFSNYKLVLITKAGSNLKRQFQSKEDTEIYLLSMSTLAPITKSEEGLVVISLTNTSLIIEAVRRTLERNPSSIIIFDNLTELAHTIGFDKVHRFLQALNEVIASFPHARLVILINKHAHQPREIQSIANIFNVFVP